MWLIDEIHRNIQSRIDNITKGVINPDIEKGKASIGEIRQRADGEFRKVSENKWEKVSSKRKPNNNFNPDFYKPDRSKTKEDAEKILKENNINDAHFVGQSYSYGASFYFERKDGTKIRISDHEKTGKTSGDYLSFSLNKISNKPSPLKLKKQVLDGEISFDVYKKLTKEYGYLLKVKKKDVALQKAYKTLGLSI